MYRIVDIRRELWQSVYASDCAGDVSVREQYISRDMRCKSITIRLPTVGSCRKVAVTARVTLKQCRRWSFTLSERLHERDRASSCCVSSNCITKGLWERHKVGRIEYSYTDSMNSRDSAYRLNVDMPPYLARSDCNFRTSLSATFFEHYSGQKHFLRVLRNTRAATIFRSTAVPTS